MINPLLPVQRQFDVQPLAVSSGTNLPWPMSSSQLFVFHVVDHRQQSYHCSHAFVFHVAHKLQTCSNSFDCVCYCDNSK